VFCIKQSDTFKWPVEFEMASAAEAGKFQKHAFEGVFKRLTDARSKELLQLADKAEAEEITGDKQAPGAKDFIRMVLVGWSGVTDESGQDVPFSETMLDRVMEYPQARWGIMYAFRKAHENQAARRKN
jgi:hypothetical protein